MNARFLRKCLAAVSEEGRVELLGVTSPSSIMRDCRKVRRVYGEQDSAAEGLERKDVINDAASSYFVNNGSDSASDSISGREPKQPSAPGDSLLLCLIGNTISSSSSLLGDGKGEGYEAARSFLPLPRRPLTGVNVGFFLFTIEWAPADLRSIPIQTLGSVLGFVGVVGVAGLGVSETTGSLASERRAIPPSMLEGECECE